MEENSASQNTNDGRDQETASARVLLQAASIQLLVVTDTLHVHVETCTDTHTHTIHLDTHATAQATIEQRGTGASIHSFIHPSISVCMHRQTRAHIERRGNDTQRNKGGKKRQRLETNEVVG